MAAALLSFAVFAALLLSPPGAGADQVTWRKCENSSWGRVLEGSPESEATHLLLTRCNLTEVRSGDFDGLPNVTYISLRSNSIAHVDPAAFRTVPQLRKLYLDNNDLREVPVFDEHSFCPGLKILHLYYNRITEITHPNTFSGCTELQEIYMCENVIGYIHPDVFRPLSKLTDLDISNNKITVISETLLIKNIKLNYLALFANKIPYLPSDFVSKLLRTGVPLQSIFFYDNPWHCSCLLELLADVKKAGVEHMYRYTGTGPVCVYNGAYPCCRPARSGLLRRAAPGH